jgi:SAM-dependent methyltransferase
MERQQHTIAVYNHHVDEYVKKFLHFDLYHDTYDSFLSLLPHHATVLELGCGPGNVVRYFSTKRPDLQITGIDLAPEMIRTAIVLNPGARFRVFDIRNLGEMVETYDVVVAAFCLPYVSNIGLDSFLNKLKDRANACGLLYLSIMEGSAERSGYEKTSFTGDDELYITYYQRERVESGLMKQGFNIERFFTKDYLETHGSVTTDLIYIARKNNTAS